MTNRYTRILLFWLTTTYAVTAQTTGSLKGHITDRKGKPISGAIVRVQGTSPARGAITKVDGSFLIAGIRAGQYDVKADAVGFLSMTMPKVRIMIDSVTTLDLHLSIKPPDSVVVTHGRLEPHKSVLLPRYDRYAGRGFVIRGGRGEGVRITRERDVELLGAADGAVEQELVEAPSPGARRIARAPWRRYRPAVAASRIFSLRDRYPLPYGWTMSDIGDQFTFMGCYPASYRLVSEAVVDARVAGIDRYGVVRRDVVEPSMAKRAEWIRGYEEHRDMMSQFERDLASWTRRR